MSVEHSQTRDSLACRLERRHRLTFLCPLVYVSIRWTHSAERGLFALCHWDDVRVSQGGSEVRATMSKADERGRLGPAGKAQESCEASSAAVLEASPTR